MTARAGGKSDRWGKKKMLGSRKTKLTVWERLDLLTDPGSLDGLNESQDFIRQKTSVPMDGVVTGTATVSGRKVIVFAEDSSYKGGSMGKIHLLGVRRAVDKAVKLGVPVIALLDSGGARVHEGVQAESEAGGMLASMVNASGRVPQICAVMGTCVGGASYAAGLCDFQVMVKGTAQMSMWGPGVVKAETGRDVSLEELGGTGVHLGRSGVAALGAKDDADCIAQVKRLLGYFPENSSRQPPRAPSRPPAKGPPTALDQGLQDAIGLLEAVFDGGSILELQGRFAPSFITALARLDGRPVGIVSSQARRSGGHLDIDSADKISRFVKTCGRFNIPIITFVDSPGFLPGPAQERRGSIRHGVAILAAYSQAAAPKITVIAGRAYGAAFTSLCSKSLGIDYVVAYPTADLSVMRPDAYAMIFHRRELGPLSADRREGLLKKITAEYRARGEPEMAVSLGYVDRLIQPGETRETLRSVLSQPVMRKTTG
jgi:acetyl-CoA carboxylase carboxyltransferase component